MTPEIQIISFYEFKDMSTIGTLDSVRTELRTALLDHEVRGTIIIASEGLNGMVCGSAVNIGAFVKRCEAILMTRLAPRSSFHKRAPFRKVDIKIKSEIVTLKREVDISLG